MIELPEVQQSPIDTATLDALVSDVQQFGKDIEVIPKGKQRGYVSEASINLADAVSQLRAGDLIAFQVRYDFDSQRWCDTIQRSGEVIRLTRISLTLASKPD